MPPARVSALRSVTNLRQDRYTQLHPDRFCMLCRIDLGGRRRNISTTRSRASGERAAGPVNGRSMTSIREIANAIVNARLGVTSACDANLRTPKST